MSKDTPRGPRTRGPGAFSLVFFFFVAAALAFLPALRSAPAGSTPTGPAPSVEAEAAHALPGQG